MGLSNFSAATGGGSSIEYVSTCMAASANCTLTKNFYGDLLGYSGGTCIQINDASLTPSTCSLRNIFLPSGSRICARSQSMAMVGCLFD